jgi:acyl-CoA synthetase (AMP-forming)/AMP-acid ligase II
VLENFALSETTFITSETLGSRYHRKEGSVGEVLPYVDVRCVGTTVEEDDEGATEILVKTPYLFLGYLQSDDNVKLPETADGYFPTDDLGELNNDGMLFYRGRKRDIIKKGGYMIVLREIEVLAEQHVLVEEAVAVPVPHDFYGEDYVLIVRLGKNPGVDDPLEEIRIWVNANLAQYKWLGKIVQYDDFPRTPSGKVRRRDLAEEIAKR